MAWVFSLSAECGANEVQAQQFAQHFNRIDWVLSNRQSSQCAVDTFQDAEENWWCRVCPNNIGETGTDTSESAYITTELGILLYQRLRSAPSFRYALVGVEVDEFRTYSELVEESSTIDFPGLVLAESVWQVLGFPVVFQPFSAGYVWKPYEGEVYNPLATSPDLKRKLNELIATQ